MKSKVIPGAEHYSIAREFGDLLAREMKHDPHFYFFSPDETTSNKLDEVYDVSERLWNLPQKSWDLPESEKGRIVELLSENALFAAMVGHILNGEQAAMASYESFFAIISSQIYQQIKFFLQSETVDWRPKYPAINLLSTSMCWRQDHNGFSHQSPTLISSLLSLPSKKVNCFFPVDDISARAVWKFMKESENVVNLTTFDKNENPRWVDEDHAKYLVEEGGASVFAFASDDDPELTIAAAGDIPVREALAAVKLLRDCGFKHRVRVTAVTSLVYNRIGTTSRELTEQEFGTRFGKHVPILSTFHGYAEIFANILRGYGAKVISAHGYEEHGSTTTPMEMLTQNHNSRYDLARAVAAYFKCDDLVALMDTKIRENHEHALAYGVDKEF